MRGKLTKAMREPGWAFSRLRAKLVDRLPHRRVVGLHGGAFFSNFNKVMTHLVALPQAPNLRAIEPDWRVTPDVVNIFPYGRQEDGNVWDRLFEPLPRRPWLPALRTNRFVDYTLTGEQARELYRSARPWRQTYHAAYRKFVRIRPHLRARVDEVHAQHLAGRRCLGVHCRSVLHMVEQPDGRIPGIEQYLERSEALLRSMPGDTALFLATDVIETVDAFRQRFGDRVVVQPGVERESPDTGRQLCQRHPDPHLGLGEQVLIDCLLLARCDALVHITSNIATAVGYINPDIEMIYCEP